MGSLVALVLPSMSQHVALSELKHVAACRA
jgi:hypothetical protein